MTRDDIIRMARDAGFRFADEENPLLANHAEWQRRLFERFGALVAAAEREACAKVCEMTYEGAFEGARPCFETPEQCAAAIRARSNP